MRVLLARIPEGLEFDPAVIKAQPEGEPVYAWPGSPSVVGKCTAVSVHGREVWATLALDESRMPSELLGATIPSCLPVSINRDAR